MTGRPSVCKGCGTPLEQPPRGRRVWCSERCRKAQYQRPCVDCGAPCGGGDVSLRCAACNRAFIAVLQRSRVADRDAQIIAMRAARHSNVEIAHALDASSPDVIANRVRRLRKAGVQVAAAKLGRPSAARGTE